MTKAQAFQKITSKHKWYVGYCSQGYASQFIARYWAGQLKYSTVSKFLGKFGYQCIKEEEWGYSGKNSTKEQ